MGGQFEAYGSAIDYLLLLLTFRSRSQQLYELIHGFIFINTSNPLVSLAFKRSYSHLSLWGV